MNLDNLITTIAVHTKVGELGIKMPSVTILVIDPILTQLAQGYKNTDGVATFFAPSVSMSVRAGRTLTFGKEAL